MSENLAYKRGADLLHHAFRFMEGALKVGQDPDQAAARIVRAVGNAFARVLDRKGEVILRRLSGDIVVETEIRGDDDTTPENRKRLRELCATERFGPDGLLVKCLDGPLTEQRTLLVGVDARLLGSLGGELWLLFSRCRESDEILLKHKQTWSLLMHLIRTFHEQAVVREFLLSTSGIFDDENRKSFLAVRVMERLSRWRQSALPEQLEPAIYEALVAIIQAHFLLSFGRNDPWMTPRGSDGGIESAEEWVMGLQEDDPDLKRVETCRPLIRILGALWGRSELGGSPPNTEEVRDLALWWLGHWSALMREARFAHVDSNGSQSALEANWAEVLPAAITATARFLVEWSPGDRSEESERSEPWRPGEFSAAYISPWLRLWFCHELMQIELLEEGFQKTPLSESRRRRYRLALAYVARETVRFFLFGRRADYRFRPRLIAQALRRLVVHHAERALAVPPALGLSELLSYMEEWSGDGSVGDSPNSLQHALDVYVATQFLGRLQVGDGRDLWTDLTSHTSSPPSLQARCICRATAIASLLHGFGRLLFPVIGSHLPNFQGLAPDLRAALSKLEGSLRGAGRTVADEALSGLRREVGFLSPSELVTIERWQEERLGNLSEPEPAVLGAWYLNELMRQSGMSSEVRRQAVRAVLLARVTAFEVEIEKDPAAALLILCDALFARKAQPREQKELAIGREFSSLQGAGRPVGSPYDAIRIPDLMFSLDKRGAQTGSPVEVFSASFSDRSWHLPSLEIVSGRPHHANEQSIVALWLGLSTSLGRVRDRGLPTQESGTERRPWLRIESRCEGTLTAAGYRITELVGEVAHDASTDLRRALEEWLAVVDGSSTQGSTESQQIELNPAGIVFSQCDPTPLFEELSERLRLVLLEHLADPNLSRR